MGTPRFNEAYANLSGKSVVIYFYYTKRQQADGLMTKDECIPVVIEENILIGWGDEFYKRKVEVDVKVR